MTYPAVLSENLNIGEVVVALKAGDMAWRVGWVRKRGLPHCIELQMPEEHSRKTPPYICASIANSDRVPYALSSADILADDWKVLS